MLPTTLALFIATQMSFNPPKPSCSTGSEWNTRLNTCDIVEKNCGTRAAWERSTQSCRVLPPSRELCWADGQELDATGKACTPVQLSAFCREHNWDYEQENTVSRILNELNAHDCEEAEGILQKSRKLSLRSAGYLKIADLRPLRALPFIEELNLDGQRVSDLAPLQKLGRLKKLSLRNNDVFDVTPLLSLSRLESLDLSGNPINPKDPALKLLQKKIKVIMAAPAVELEAPGMDEGAGFVIDSE